MPKFFSVPFLLVLFTAAAWGGEAVRPVAGPRQEFRQRKTYPYVFEPVPYLENGTPPPLRFGESSSDCSKHNPPLPPPQIKKVEPAATPAPTPVPPKVEPAPTPIPPKPEPPQPTPPPEETTIAKPAFPPPDNAQPVPSSDSLDITKYPGEVVDIFKNPYNAPKSRKRFFDPVFEPAQMPNKAQPSKATYRQE